MTSTKIHVIFCVTNVSLKHMKQTSLLESLPPVYMKTSESLEFNLMSETILLQSSSQNLVGFYD
jgi:hypothetical protein